MIGRYLNLRRFERNSRISGILLKYKKTFSKIGQKKLGQNFLLCYPIEAKHEEEKNIFQFEEKMQFGH
jgi:hypothetical protein